MGSPPSRRTPLTHILADRIRHQGPMTFAQFMEACLYHPQHGYYSRPSPMKESGDYFTSADAGPLFGRLLARQFREMWSIMGGPKKFDLVECGAGGGRLAEQILLASRQWPEFAGCLRMTLVEASEERRKEAQAVLHGAEVAVHVPTEVPAGIRGCLFSNELLDALPVHRVVQRAEGLREVYISQRDGELVEEEGQISSPAIGDYLKRYGSELAEGQLAEIHLGALGWLEAVAAALERGFLLTIDYGHRAPELYGPGHLRGTVLAYRHHRAHEEWLSWPGEQDLTAHVNFTALEERGRELGLEPVGLTTQTNFLLALARAGGFADLEAQDSCDFDELAVRLAFKQLIHPEGMGETFRVLVQAKGVGEPELSGLKPL